jgi:uncharacterized membrane protein YoaK (UPF0700 family)
MSDPTRPAPPPSSPAVPPNPLVVSLSALTIVSGVVDAVSYLGLGHVFTANMTGNVVLVGFAIAGAPGFSIAASLTALAFFLLGAAAGGRIVLWLPAQRTLLLIAMTLEAAFVAVAALIAASVSAIGTGWPRYVLISLLAVTMGVRNAAVRHIAVRDMTTTVITQTLTGLAADSSLGGGHNPNVLHRSISVLGMFVGALIGATLLLHGSPGWALGLAAALVAGTLVFFARQTPVELGLAS